LDGKKTKHLLAGVRIPTTIGKIERWHRTARKDVPECSDENSDEKRFIFWSEDHELHEESRISSDNKVTGED